MTAVVLTYGVPWPLNSGARIRDEGLIRNLAALGVAIHLVCFAKDEHEIPNLAQLEDACASVTIFRPPLRGLTANLAAAWRGWRGGRPLAMLPFFFPELNELLQNLLVKSHADILQIEHSFLAAYRQSAQALPGVRTILSMHNLGFQQYARMARLAGPAEWFGAAIKAALMKDWEAAWASKFDVCVTVSHADAELLRESGCTAEISVVENGVDCERLRMLPRVTSADMLFAGVIGYAPNADAVEYFSREILPKIRLEVPEARLFVVGRSPPDRVLRLHCESVIVTGEVLDMQPWYRRCRLSIVPLRSGGGTRLKILEAMALGRPVVSTTIGCEGIVVTPGRELLVADTPAAFAAHVVRLIREDNLWSAIASDARLAVETAYSWNLLGRRLHAIYVTQRDEKLDHVCH